MANNQENKFLEKRLSMADDAGKEKHVGQKRIIDELDSERDTASAHQSSNSETLLPEKKQKYSPLPSVTSSVIGEDEKQETRSRKRPASPSNEQLLASKHLKSSDSPDSDPVDSPPVTGESNAMLQAAGLGYVMVMFHFVHCFSCCFISEL